MSELRERIAAEIAGCCINDTATADAADRILALLSEQPAPIASPAERETAGILASMEEAWGRPVRVATERGDFDPKDGPALSEVRGILKTEPKPCGCWRCLLERGEDMARMVVCDICGNKRCPHATDHHLACTGSNDSGQPGSVYGSPLTPYHPDDAALRGTQEGA